MANKYCHKKFRNEDILFIDGRIKKKDRKPGLHYYDIRHDDEQWLPETIEPGVLINHYGTIVSYNKLDLDIIGWKDGGYINLSEEEKDDFCYIDKERYTLDEYSKKFSEDICCNVFLGTPVVNILGVEYDVHIFNRLSSFNKGSAYIYNNLVLPYKGKLQDNINAYLEAGIYEHNEHTFLIFSENKHLYSVNNIREK